MFPIWGKNCFQIFEMNLRKKSTIDQKWGKTPPPSLDKQKNVNFHWPKIQK